jgi:hypothetical protein
MLYEFGEDKIVDEDWRKLEKILYEAQEYLSSKITNTPTPQDQAIMRDEEFVSFSKS